MATRSTAADNSPKIGQMIHYTLGADVPHAGECTPAHVLEVKKNKKDSGEIIGRDVERLNTVGMVLVDPTLISSQGLLSLKTPGREYSKDLHAATWHYPTDCGL